MVERGQKAETGRAAAESVVPPAATEYVGRFAPSPTGPLHFGSLVAAVASFLQARVSAGKWLLRIEDLDTPRNVSGAADGIVKTLEAFGFEWSGTIEYQSRRLSKYEAALSTLKDRHLVFPCSCSRSQIAASDDQRYPGTCRQGVSRSGEPVAQRLRVDEGLVEFEDRLQGRFTQDVSKESGDFVVQRRDGIFAYHLAVVVDDADQGVTEIVRGADLLESTPRHILVQKALGLSLPSYAHLPLAVDEHGKKLSKSSQSIPVDVRRRCEALWESLVFLRQSPPAEIRAGSLQTLWQWALAHWRLAPLRQLKSGPAPLPEESCP